MKCFYHSADLDGHCSGAIVRQFNPGCEMHGINYGDPFPWENIERKEQIVMVDFSLQPFSDMMKLADYLDGQGGDGLLWIDHHKSAIIEWEEHNRPFQNVMLDNSKAACELCWELFAPHKPLPLAVHWLGRYDIWKHEDIPGCLEFQYGMRLKNTWPEEEIWTWLLDPKCDAWSCKVAEEGKTCLAYERKMNESFCHAYAFETELDGLRCIAINKGMTNSLVLESVYDRAKHDAMLTFAFRKGQWTISLYSDKPEIDVSTICKARGGGGHRGAAGFQCQQLPFLAPNS